MSDWAVKALRDMATALQAKMASQKEEPTEHFTSEELQGVLARLGGGNEAAPGAVGLHCEYVYANPLPYDEYRQKNIGAYRDCAGEYMDAVWHLAESKRKSLTPQ